MSKLIDELKFGLDWSIEDNAQALADKADALYGICMKLDAHPLEVKVALLEVANNLQRRSIYKYSHPEEN